MYHSLTIIPCSHMTCLTPAIAMNFASDVDKVTIVSKLAIKKVKLVN